jgi:uroporphyrinogen-III decarboxylase
MMTHRERLLAVIEGKAPDRIPWIPRLSLWYTAQQKLGKLPDRFRGMNLRQIERDLGLGTPARNGRIFKTQLSGVEIKTKRKGVETLTEYTTPVGTVSIVYRHSEELARVGLPSLQIEHMIKHKADYPVVEYIINHTEVIPTYEEYLAYEEAIGDEGVPLVSLGSCPIHRILREFIGYNDGFYALYDYPAQIESLLASLEIYAAKLQRVALESPAKMILYGIHFDSQMTPPPLFKEYFLPHFKAFSKALHERDKILVCHADNDTKFLLSLIKEAGFDMAECFVTAPMVHCTLAEARQDWGNDVIIWGGIPSSILCPPVTDEVFEMYMEDLFRTIVPGDAFILGVADNVMPDAYIERVIRVSEMVEAYGKYPVGV